MHLQGRAGLSLWEAVLRVWRLCLSPITKYPEETERELGGQTLVQHRFP